MKRIILSVFAAAVTAAWAIPASAGDVTFSGQYRLRGEYLQNNNPATPYDDSVDQNSQDLWAQRVRLTANAKATDDVSAKITVQDTRVFGSGLITEASNTALDKIDLHEAYLNVNGIFGTPVNLRAGRQELVYGDERLIGAFGWGNNGRAFDGFKFTYNTEAISVDAFATTIMESTGYVVDGTKGSITFGTSDSDRNFNGVYATLKQLVPNNTLDVYFLHQNNAAAGEAVRYTLGARLKGAAAGVDYTVELPYQFGDMDNDDSISAWAFAAKAGYTLPTPMNVRVGVEYDYATGDKSTTDTENNNFDNLFPTNHMHFGIGDATTKTNSWSDIQAWSINASADLNEKTRATVAYWDYTENEVVAPASDDLGSAIDLIVTHKYNNAVTLEAGLSHFMPGEGTTGSATAPDDARDWAYLQVTANF